LKKQEKDKEVTEDDVRRGQIDIQKISDKFIKEMGQDKAEPQPELNITSSRSSSETNVVVLEYARETD